MRAGLLVTGVLGAGTVLVFVAAALTASLFPGGTVVNPTWNGGGVWVERGWGVAVPAPMPVVIDEDMAWPEGRDGGTVVGEPFMPLPGDLVEGVPEK